MPSIVAMRVGSVRVISEVVGLQKGSALILQVSSADNGRTLFVVRDIQPVPAPK